MWLELNQTTKDWHTRSVTLSETKGLALRFFATLRMTKLSGHVVKCTNVVWSDLESLSKISAHCQRAIHAVLVKAVPPVCAAEVGPVETVDAVIAFLRGQRGMRIDRVMIRKSADDLRWSDRRAAVERDAERLGGR